VKVGFSLQIYIENIQLEKTRRKLTFTQVFISDLKNIVKVHLSFLVYSYSHNEKGSSKYDG
jgi:hypothetical protein